MRHRFLQMACNLYWKGGLMTASGRIHSVETCGTVDGPGIRFVVFSQGCPLRCIYCHNPDTWNRNDGSVMRVDALMAELRKYRSYIEASGGGLTLSGGEPLLQPAFAKALLSAAKKEGFHTALDTAGFAEPDVVAPVLDHTDLLLFDIKGIRPDLFRSITGRSCAHLPLTNLALAQEKGISVWIRYVLVPGITDSPDVLEETARTLQNYPCIEQIQVLPFHKMGEYKWDAMHLTRPLAKTPAATAESVKKAQEMFAAKGWITA